MLRKGKGEPGFLEKNCFLILWELKLTQIWMRLLSFFVFLFFFFLVRAMKASKQKVFVLFFVFSLDTEISSST